MKVAILRKGGKNLRTMPAKPDDEKNDTVFQFRCRADELADFKRAAKREGFSTISAWLLWHLRKAVRESEKDR